MQNGGKANSLIRLRKGGFLTPPFFVCDSSWTEEKILEKIRTDLPNTPYFAVRSSAENEDSKDHSFAGHFYSAIGVPTGDVFTKVRKVQDSFDGMAGSVIVQKFIPSDSAGVVFTEVDKNAVVINATLGLCQTVVEGYACDEYICDKTGAILSQIIAKEKEIKIFSKGRITSQRTGAESLTVGRIRQLVQLATKIQSFFGSPQDVEWCFMRDRLYVLQSRPITRDFSVKQEEYFDSANIAESYSGIVLPLTCSFAELVYEQVYKDLLRMSGVSRKKIELHARVFKNLLRVFYGRMYYNMNNWYHMAAFVPGYKRNKENLELMITSNVNQNVVTSIRPSLALKIFYPIIVSVKICFFGLTSRYFKFNVKHEIRRLRGHDFRHLTYSDCIKLFNSLQKNLLRRWYIAIENDFFVMTYLGILKKNLNEKSLQVLITFPSKATEQVAALTALSKKAKSISSFWETIESNNPRTFNEGLRTNSEFRMMLENYMTEFGGRFANELKLESVGIDEDTTKLLSILKVYSTYQPKSYDSRQSIPMPFFKKIALYFVLNKFKKYASRREEFRLLRSNTFAIARRLFRQMGELLAKQSVLENADDIFYLQLPEILYSSAINNNKLKLIVKKRKQQYAVYKNISLPAHFATGIGALPSMRAAENSKNLTLKARPASPGVVRGRIKIFKEFFMPREIGFDILVTSHTDPGWTSLIALSKGLIIEHGGVLSHASIVARELHIPAVIGATNATNTLQDNQIVEINGSNGIIKII